MTETLKDYLLVAGGAENEELLPKMKKLRLRPACGKKTLGRVRGPHLTLASTTVRSENDEIKDKLLYR